MSAALANKIFIYGFAHFVCSRGVFDKIFVIFAV